MKIWHLVPTLGTIAARGIDTQKEVTVNVSEDIDDDVFEPNMDYVNAVCEEYHIADSGDTNFHYSDDHCEYYIQCGTIGQANGVNECQVGLVFNDEKQYCDHPANVPPPCGTKDIGYDDSICKDADGFHPNPEKDDEFFICRGGHLHVISCPGKFEKYMALSFLFDHT